MNQKSSSHNKRSNTSADLKQVKEHYEDYPYPYRDPEEEKTRMLTIFGESLDELNHWLYRGAENFNNKFRVLIAGGGTGDSLIYIAEQLKDKNAELVYLDFSQASMAIAKARAEIRGLSNITWILDSILNIPNLNLGKFDFINCSGVLHHLSSPSQGLSNLKSVLKDTGGMNLMIYAKYGRTGVYQVQELMKMVNSGVDNRVQEIMNGKVVINALPSTNWYVRGQDLLADHIHFGDIGLYDMFLHKQDRAYSIPEMHEFVKDAGLHFVNYSYASDRVALKVENYIKDFSLLQRIKKMDMVTQHAISELIIGSIIKHTFYVSNAKDTSAAFSDLDNVPYFFGIIGCPEKLCELFDSSVGANGKHFNTVLNTAFISNHYISVPVSQYTKPILKELIGENKSLKEMFDNIRSEVKSNVSDASLIQECKILLMPFIEAGVLLLKNKSCIV